MQVISYHESNEESTRPNLDVLPEVFQASVVVVIIWPFGPIHHDLPGERETVQRHVCKVRDLADVLLAYTFAFSTVVEVVSEDGGGDGEEDEPVARGQTRAFVEP